MYLCNFCLGLNRHADLFVCAACVYKGGTEWRRLIVMQKNNYCMLADVCRDTVQRVPTVQECHLFAFHCICTVYIRLWLAV